MKKTVQELADLISGTVIGDGTRVIEDVKGLAEAKKEDITFAVHPYTEYLPQVHAGAVIVQSEVPAGDNTLIIVENPRLAFSQLLVLFHPRQSVEPGIHATAIVDSSATLGSDTAVMAYAVIGKNVVIGEGCTIYPYVFIGDNVHIGKDTAVFPGAVIHENTVIGERNVIRAHAVLGGEGFGFATNEGKHTHIPQIGNVVLGDDVELGSCSCIDNATLGSTIVKRGTKIDNLVHLGHNVEVGEDCFIIAQSGIAGSTKTGNHCIFAGQTGIAGHVTIGDDVVLAGKTGVTGNIKSGQIYAGYPGRPHMEWKRTSVYLRNLPKLVKKVRNLEKQIAELEKQIQK
ncbi:MAG: UDP-3-O-(3-hydroxymyristoyl)glucosamine N-acyltransferase [Megasphaera sp.]|jgi:UDP-3-O-[3-hydroxymyristoyl] glucosamine N-acyltransferase|nr:UDP-3-O-(3-hydroxymyristoyl)glucosamine N-acyltransferase [Megasphaera sp.]MCI1248052.1 UDP-3-O-(3-hydroxymyristoyl)glucosamine N-acyltransferase [Megasphaera sp.]